MTNALAKMSPRTKQLSVIALAVAALGGVLYLSLAGTEEGVKERWNAIHGQLPVCKCSGDFLGTTPPGGRVHARPPFNTWRSHTTKFGLSRIRVGNSCAESNRQTVVE